MGLQKVVKLTAKQGPGLHRKKKPVKKRVAPELTDRWREKKEQPEQNKKERRGESKGREQGGEWQPDLALFSTGRPKERKEGKKLGKVGRWIS